MKKGVQKGVNSKNEKKKSLIIILKSINFGADAKSNVTLKIAPSYTSHNHAWNGAEPTLNNNAIKVNNIPAKKKGSLLEITSENNSSKDVEPKAR
jgi:hypothetical protein